MIAAVDLEGQTVEAWSTNGSTANEARWSRWIGQ